MDQAFLILKTRTTMKKVYVCKIVLLDSRHRPGQRKAINQDGDQIWNGKSDVSILNNIEDFVKDFSGDVNRINRYI